ncbi:phosphatidylinositol-3,4,5-trisphosphate binding [Balamuthia mandrillaris]
MLLKSGSVLNLKGADLSDMGYGTPMTHSDRKRMIIAVAGQPGNNRCADCGMPDPEWASINLGIFICILCAGVHRSLGAHISKVRSIVLDDWENDTIKFMESVGNDKANAIWNNNLPPDLPPINPKTDVKTRDHYIRTKYILHGDSAADKRQPDSIPSPVSAPSSPTLSHYHSAPTQEEKEKEEDEKNETREHPQTGSSSAHEAEAEST